VRGRRVLVSCITGITAAVLVTASASAGTTQRCTVRGWGMLTGGKPFPRRLSPTSVSIPDSFPVVQVGSSNSTEYALLADGTLWAWGVGTHGQLGDGADRNSLSTPVRVKFPAGVSVAYIPVNSMPFNTGLAVDTTGHAWGWGLNGAGDLCLGFRQSFSVPVRLPFADVTALAGASNHAVYDAGGVLYSCGDDKAGALGAGAGAPSQSFSPIRVKKLSGSGVIALVSAFENAGALLASGQYYDWGLNTAGQLGDGGTRHSPVPVRVSLPGFSPVVQAAQGGSLFDNGQTLVKLADGTVYGWGDNSYQQLDPNGPSAQLTPRRIHVPAGLTYATLATGGSTSYAITSSHDVYAWGQNDHGQVGDGTTQDARRPVRVTSSASVISATAKNVVVGCTAG
jgi:alpha-tubulin suppressor-like RCC1 family protein